MLVMSAPTVDITNLDTSKLQPSDDTEYFQQKTTLSSQNMFSLAERSIRQNPYLNKVIVMEHPPRFDTADVDPCSLKPKLAKLANVTLGQLWMNSSLKDKICIGSHSLESSGNGDGHFARYQNYYTGKYDGVHFYGQAGCTDYTNSVKTILKMALPKLSPTKPATESGTAQSNNHKSCPQTKYQQKMYHPSVQTKNRFNILNQGNC